MSNTTADDAVQYILERVGRDVNFAWYMFGTEALAKCYTAWSEKTGRTREDIEGELYRSLEAEKARSGRKSPDVKLAEERLRRIEDAVHELDGFHALNSQRWFAIRDLILKRE